MKLTAMQPTVTQPTVTQPSCGLTGADGWRCNNVRIITKEVAGSFGMNVTIVAGYAPPGTQPVPVEVQVGLLYGLVSPLPELPVTGNDYVLVGDTQFHPLNLALHLWIDTAGIRVRLTWTCCALTICR